MEPNQREQLALVVAGLLGVIFGHILKRIATPHSERHAMPFTSISMSTLVATPGLAHIAGEVIGVEEDNLPVRAGLTFATGAVLTFFADTIGRRLPGVLPSGRARLEA